MKKHINFQSLLVTLAISFLALCEIVLSVTGCLSIYGSFQTNRGIIFRRQRLIAKEAAGTVKSFVQEKC